MDWIWGCYAVASMQPARWPLRWDQPVLATGSDLPALHTLRLGLGLVYAGPVPALPPPTRPHHCKAKHPPPPAGHQVATPQAQQAYVGPGGL